MLSLDNFHPIEEAITQLVSSIYSGEELITAAGKIGLGNASTSPAPTIYIAYSGGMDSSALLHACSKLHVNNMLPHPIIAWHINHNISKQASKWEEHCRAECAKLQIKINCSHIEDEQQRQESVEMYARRCRYRIWREGMQENDILLQAHHRRDQSETLLLRLVRGSPNLKGIPRLRRLMRGGGAGGYDSRLNLASGDIASTGGKEQKRQHKSGIVARPLLNIDKQSIIDYVATHKLGYIEDEMNLDISNDRSYIRHRVLPPLHKKWKSADKNIALAAQRLDAYNEAIPYAQQQLLAKYGREQKDGTIALDVSSVALSAQLFDILVRGWLASLPTPLPPPPPAVMQELRCQMKSAADKLPLLTWEGGEIRRYRNLMHAMLPTQAKVMPKAMEELKLPTGTSTNSYPLPLGILTLKRIIKSTTESIVKAVDEKQTPGESGDVWDAHDVVIAERGEKLLLGFRHGGEVIALSPSGKTRELKKLLQEKGIPPWQRDCIPLIYMVGAVGAADVVGAVDAENSKREELIAIPGIGVAKHFAPNKDKKGLHISWKLR